MSELLPSLQNPIEEQVQYCPGSAICPSCPLFEKEGGPCTGCDAEYYNRCQKHQCDSNCNRCGGGETANVTACCGRSPLRSQWEEIMDTEVKPYAPPPLSIKSRFIPVIFAQIAKYNIPDLFPEIDAWVVPAHKCMNLKGEFRRDNLKDYLGLPRNRKLILSTSVPDNFIEMFWERWEKIDFKSHGVDYWFPGHFSIYDHDSKFYQFFNAKRQQIHAVRVKSRFVWFRLSDHIPVRYLNPVHKGPSVLLSCQQMYSPYNRSVLEREARIADEFFPLSSSFYLVKKRAAVPFQRKRKVYVINEHWLMTGLMGRNIQNKPEKHMSIPELLKKNLGDFRDEILQSLQ